MMKKVNIVMKANHLWTQEEEDRLTARIVDNFCDLINRSEEEGLYWTGLKCDLIDLAHMVWETGRLMDKCGRPMDFQTIVHHICRVLHVREPCNPSSVISSVRARKNVRVGPLRERYLQLISKANIQDPMRLEIRKRKASPPTQLAPPPCPSPIGRGVKCERDSSPTPLPLPHREGSNQRDTPIG